MERDLIAYLSELARTRPDVVEKLVASQGLEGLLETFRVAEETLEAKGVAHFFEATELVAESLGGSDALIPTATSRQPMVIWSDCFSEAQTLWRAAEQLWTAGNPQVATALSITVLEESGKLWVERLRLLGPQSSDVPRSSPEQESEDSRRPTGVLRQHNSKHLIAAGATLMVNARCDRILGTDFVTQTIRKAKKGKLEDLRQRCLYIGNRHGTLQLPSKAIDSETSSKYVAIAGESLADIHPDPDVHREFIHEVERFEVSAGLLTSGTHGTN